MLVEEVDFDALVEQEAETVREIWNRVPPLELLANNTGNYSDAILLAVYNNEDGFVRAFQDTQFSSREDLISAALTWLMNRSGDKSLPNLIKFKRTRDYDNRTRENASQQGFYDPGEREFLTALITFLTNGEIEQIGTVLIGHGDKAYLSLDDDKVLNLNDAPGEFFRKASLAKFLRKFKSQFPGLGTRVEHVPWHQLVPFIFPRHRLSTQEPEEIAEGCLIERLIWNLNPHAEAASIVDHYPISWGAFPDLHEGIKDLLLQQASVRTESPKQLPFFPVDDQREIEDLAAIGGFLKTFGRHIKWLLPRNKKKVVDTISHSNSEEGFYRLSSEQVEIARRVRNTLASLGELTLMAEDLHRKPLSSDQVEVAIALAASARAVWKLIPDFLIQNDFAFTYGDLRIDERFIGLENLTRQLRSEPFDIAKLSGGMEKILQRGLLLGATDREVRLLEGGS